MISGNENWLGCQIIRGHGIQRDQINLYSTKFPFTNLKVELPPIGKSDAEGYYDQLLSLNSWSPSGDAFVVGFWKTTGENSHNVCIVKIESNESYEVNCFPKMGVFVDGSFAWSTDGKTILYSYPSEGTLLHFVVLDQNAQILNEFNVSIKKYLQEGEEYAGGGGIWTGSELYLDLEFRPESTNITTFSINRSSLVLVSANDPERVTPLAIGKQRQLFDAISVDPKSKMVLIKKTDANDYTGSLLVMTIKNREVIQEFPLGNSKVITKYCLKNCPKIAMEIADAHQNSSLLVWSWDEMKLKTYPISDLWSVLGVDNVKNGFLTLWNGFKLTGFPIIVLYK